MISIDCHAHTAYSHGKDSVGGMVAAAAEKGLAVFGLSEHSLRPPGYGYASDYQERLAANFPSYIAEVLEERRKYQGRMTVLLGLELDYIPAEEAFARKACAAAAYDYVIGGLHFQEHWGFDGSAAEWANLSTQTCREHFVRYYHDLEKMACSGLFQIAAHPDLIKLFRPDDFQAWLDEPDALALIRRALAAIKEQGMALEVSSAALRKGLGEPYPAPPIMALAVELGLPISFASDAHAAGDVAWGFGELAAYAHRFGYTESVWFQQKSMISRPFS